MSSEVFSVCVYVCTVCVCMYVCIYCICTVPHKLVGIMLRIIGRYKMH